MSRCKMSNVELFHVEKGQGTPLVFLNGLSGDHLYWSGQLRHFGKSYRCLAIDNRDVGQSPAGTGPYSVPDMADDVAALLQRLGLPPAHVVGLSMGGMIAQELALQAPRAVASLTLVDTLGRSDEWFQGTLRTFDTIRRAVADTPAFFDAILPWWVSHRFFERPDRVEWLRWLLRQTPYPQSLEGFLRQLAATGGHDALDRLSRVACPTLVLAGEDDMICPPRYSRELADRIPGARLTLVPGVGHALPFEDPGRFTELLGSFLASQSAASRPAAPVAVPG